MAGTLALAAHGMEVAIERMEGCVGQPCLVEMQVIDIAVEHAFDGLGVVEHAIIGGLRQRHDARLDGVRIDMRQQRVGPDFVLDRLDLELRLLDRSDDPVVVARRLHEDGNRPGHDDAVQDRLVAVAVDHDDIAGGNGVVPDHLVGRAGAVGDEEAMVGVEDPRSVAFGRANGTVMVEQLAKFLDRVAHIGAQHVFAVELVIHLPDRAFQERHAAGMPRTMPRVGSVFRVVEQGLEERGLDAFQIGFGVADDVAGHEFGRIFEHMDEAVQLAQDVVRQDVGWSWFRRRCRSARLRSSSALPR